MEPIAKLHLVYSSWVLAQSLCCPNVSSVLQISMMMFAELVPDIDGGWDDRSSTTTGLPYLSGFVINNVFPLGMIRIGNPVEVIGLGVFISGSQSHG